MLRLTVLLCGGVFLVLLIAGQDRGQMRQGLLNVPSMAEATTAAPPAAPAAPDVTEAVFVPAQPSRAANAARKPAVVPTPPVAAAVPPAAEPQGRLAMVGARAVNVRSGPSTAEPVIGRLTADEQVLVVSESSPVEGWSLVRIEGDGIEGYVASRLLLDVAP